MKVSLCFALVAAVLLLIHVKATNIQDQIDATALTDLSSLSSASNGLSLDSLQSTTHSLSTEADDDADDDSDEDDDLNDDEDGGDDDDDGSEDDDEDDTADDGTTAAGLDVASRRFSAKRLDSDRHMLSPAFQMARVQQAATGAAAGSSRKSQGPAIVPPFLEGDGCRSAKITPLISASTAKGTKGTFTLSFKSFSAPKSGSSWCSAVTQIAHIPPKGCTIVSKASITASPNLTKGQSANLTHSVFYALYPNPPGVQSRVQKFTGPEKKSTTLEMVKVSVSPSVNTTEPVIVFVANRATIGASVAAGLGVTEMKYKIVVSCK